MRVESGTLCASLSRGVVEMFFFQAEDGIRDIGVTGVQTCALPILLGLFAEFTPKFVKRYRRLGDAIRDAAREYANEVRDGRFPSEEHVYRGTRRDKGRSEERRVGKECRSRWSAYHSKQNTKQFAA